MKIEETKAYRQLGEVSQLIVSKSASKKRIQEAVTMVRTIGVEKWERITNLPILWHNIVKELAV
ncbi:hypothetical protein [Myroides phaeus]|uniref:Uncharacterized protein n=1 Tax=Myroides phaeus TaxID=702745 RepID=A0A1G8EI25_9FLAO|nr:hypothetical protein [Myroides phaeus]SDH69450.1 hypothetical protein SAMN05421818_1119 [Myroides phaeus]